VGCEVGWGVRWSAAKGLEVADIRRQKSEFVDISCRYVALSHVQPSRSLSTETERRRPPPGHPIPFVRELARLGNHSAW
jgi:hypothetical protein